MVLQRTLFLLISAVATLFVCIGGILGGEALAIRLFGSEIGSTPFVFLSLQSWILLLFMGLGALFSGVGFLALIVMPLCFLFPNASKPFSWQGESSTLSIVVLRWYAVKLRSYAKELRKNA
jgi:hypothetical protein